MAGTVRAPTDVNMLHHLAAGTTIAAATVAAADAAKRHVVRRVYLALAVPRTLAGLRRTRCLEGGGGVCEG